MKSITQKGKISSQSPMGSELGYSNPMPTARDLLGLLFRDWVVFVRVVLVIIAFSAMIGISYGVSYPVTASVLVLPSRNYVFREEVGERETGQLYSMSGSEYVLSEAQIIKSRDVLTMAIEHVGLSAIFPDLGRKVASNSLSLRKNLEARLMALMEGRPAEDVLREEKDRYQTKIRELAVSRILKKLTVQTTKDSNVILLNYGHSSPLIAKQVLDEILASYIERRHDLYSVRRSELFTIQREKFNERLADKEREIAEFKQSGRFNAFDEQKNLMVRLQAEILGDRIEAKSRLSESQSKINRINSILKELPRDVLDSEEKLKQDSAASARTALVSLESRRNEMLTKFHSQSRYIQNLDDQIRGMRQTIDQSQPTLATQERHIRNPTISSLETQLAASMVDADSYRGRIEALDLEKKNIDQRLQDFDQLEGIHELLTLSRDQLKENLKTYAQKVEEALILEEMERQKFDNVRIIEPPRLPDRKSNYFLIFVGLSLFLGPIFGILFLIIKHKARQVYISPEEVERSVGFPVLISVSEKH